MAKLIIAALILVAIWGAFLIGIIHDAQAISR